MKCCVRIYSYNFSTHRWGFEKWWEFLYSLIFLSVLIFAEILIIKRILFYQYLPRVVRGYFRILQVNRFLLLLIIFLNFFLRLLLLLFNLKCSSMWCFLTDSLLSCESGKISWMKFYIFIYSSYNSNNFMTQNNIIKRLCEVFSHKKFRIFLSNFRQ